MKHTKEHRFIGQYLPLALILIYLGTSYLLYRNGCYIWPFRKDTLTCIFVVLCMLSLALGYILATKLRRRKIETQSQNFFTKISAEKILLLSCVISVAIFIPVCKAYTNSWYPPIIKSLTDPKGTYYELADVALNRTGVRIWGFLDVFSYVLLPLTLWAWDELKKWVRTLALVTAIGYLSIYISSARNIAVAIQMLSVLAVWLSSLFVEKKEGEKSRLWKTTLLAAGYVVLVVSFFGLTMSDRTGYDEEVYLALKETSEDTSLGNIGNQETPENTNTEEADLELIKELEGMMKEYNSQTKGQSIGIGTYEYNGLKITEKQLANFYKVYGVFPNYTDAWSKAYVDMSDFFVKNLPSALSNIYVVGTVYISNGYNCLTVALHSDHQWTYGVGHSTFLSNYTDRFFHTNTSEKTYYSRLTNDRDYPLVSRSLWPSAFVQLADDLTFVGVVFFMALIGFVVAKVWNSIIIDRNYWGVLLLGQLMLGILFIPANNILGNSGGFFVTFWSLFIMWFLSQLRPRKRDVKCK